MSFGGSCPVLVVGVCVYVVGIVAMVLVKGALLGFVLVFCEYEESPCCIARIVKCCVCVVGDWG